VATTTFLYDGDCAFCSASARALIRYVRPTAAVIAWQRADLGALGVAEAVCAAAVQWIRPGAPPLAGPYAIAAALRAGRWWWRPLGVVLGWRPVATLAWPVYRWVARNRHRLPGGTTACAVPQTCSDVQSPPVTLLNITRSDGTALMVRQFNAGR
jgi:predicted DCC family thiol-disulfide oxidoreductase YuxK